MAYNSCSTLCKGNVEFDQKKLHGTVLVKRVKNKLIPFKCFKKDFDAINWLRLLKWK